MTYNLLNDLSLISIRTKLAYPKANAQAILAACALDDKPIVLTQALSLCGQNAGDLLFNPTFIESIFDALKLILKENQDSKIIGVGCVLPAFYKSQLSFYEEGSIAGSLINAYVLIQGHEILGVAKLPSALPAFYERIDNSSRYFADDLGDDEEIFVDLGLKDPSFKVFKAQSAIKVLDYTFFFDDNADAYPENLAEEYLTLDVKQSDPLSVTVNLDRAPFEAGASLKAFELAKKISENINGNYVYLAPLGCEGAYLYSGLGLMASQGQVLACGKAFAFTPFAKTTSQTQCEILKDYDEILKALAMGIMDYMSESASHGIALSLSGGADSALCATAVFYMALCALEDLGPQGLVSKLHELKIYVPLCKEDEDPLDYLRSEVMPKLLVTVYQGSENSGEVTFNAAKDLALFLGASHFSWSIAKVVNDYLKLYDDLGIGEKLSWDKDDLALQNIQARVRLPGIWLVANREGRLLLATSNLSEASVGYCTMDGDTAGGLSPIAGIGKSVVRKINAYLEEVGLLTSQGRFKVKALDKVNAQAPTAELRPGGTQTDERDLMPSVLLDAIRKALSLNVRVQDLIATIKHDPACQDFADSFIKENLERYFRLHARSQWKRERFATGFHIEHDDASPESYLHLPIFTSDLKALSAYL